MHRLRRLSLSGNPVDKITNDSFVGLQHLEELDISHIEAESFQVRSADHFRARLTESAPVKVPCFSMIMLNPLPLFPSLSFPFCMGLGLLSYQIGRGM